MASVERRRRRRDIKMQDREKSLSPLDKDDLKLRCLERVRTERSRLMARMRCRRIEQGVNQTFVHSASGDAGTGTDLPLGTTALQGAYSLSARDILRQGLSELSGGNSRAWSRDRGSEQQHLDHKQALPTEPFLQQDFESSPERVDSIDTGAQRGRDHLPQPPQSLSSSLFLSAIEEENATYLNACASGQGSPQQPRPPAGSRRHAPALEPTSTSVREDCQKFVGSVDGDELMSEDGDSREEELVSRQRPKRHQQPQEKEEDGLGWGDDGSEDYCDEYRLLSPEEYLEMMEYIEEACREEDRKAEAEILEHYETMKRLEEEEIEHAVSSGLDGPEGNGQAGVLCPVCKSDYLLEAGAPSSSIVCACGFRLDTGGDRLGLEHLRQQLADTYGQHSAACSAEPRFVVEGAPGLDVLWSSCDGCGFARVVI